MAVVTFNLNRTPYCCGALEMGGFSQHAGGVYRHESTNPLFLGEGKRSYKLAWIDALNKVFDPNRLPMYRGTRGFTVQFWFKKLPGEDKYDCPALYDLVSNHPKAKQMCEPYRNPNSGNTIVGFIIFNDGEVHFE